MPILCRVTRGELTESIHVGFAVAVNEKGEILYSTGDPQYLTCVRSALKPFQAAASIEAGAVDFANFNDREIALMCASHMGEQRHTKTAESMLRKIGLSNIDYECGAHFPSSSLVRNQMIENKTKALALHNNCSGKHAGMLALAKYLNKGTENYIDQKHPVQKLIINYIKKLTGLENIPFEIDGCSAPTPFLTLEAIAKLYQKLASGKNRELERVYNAMVKSPNLIGGTDHFDSQFIDLLKGSGIAKIGGESIRGISLKTKNHGNIGIAIKILDGNFRALPIATIKLLEHLDLLDKEKIGQLRELRERKLKNHNGAEIGRIEAYIEF